MKIEQPVTKARFRILFGTVALFAVVAVVAADAKGDEREDAEKARRKLSDLHKENWERQKSLYTWPGNSRLFKALDEKALKFGEPIPELAEAFGEFQRRETYLAAYSSLNKGGSGPGTGMADLVAPTQFKGGWQSVLRHVNDFGQLVATKDQVWLALEDMWVQRSLLSGIRSVNADTATFERVKYEKGGAVIDDPDPKGKAQSKTQRLFRNRTWEVALEVVPEGRSFRLAATLTNTSDRLQLLGAGNAMTLKVWLSSDPTAVPFLFKIGGEFLPGKGALRTTIDKEGRQQVVPANVMNVVPTDDHTLPPGFGNVEIARVEQVFDARTVPVRRIDALVIGHPLALDGRNGSAAPLLPLSEGLAKEPPPEAPPAAGGPGPAGGLPGAAGAGGGRLASGGGRLTDVTDANKNRYLAVSPQVRRMPVGLVVVVDQTHIQDVLLALANSPLRFQITQVSLTRFRGALGGEAPGNGPAAGGIDIAAPGSLGAGLGGSGDPDGPPPKGPIGPIGPPGPPRGGPPRPAGPAPSVLPESQATAGLVELSVCGVVSLYEKYDAARPDDAKKLRDAIKLVVAGHEERLNWPRLVEAFTASLPRPGDAKDGGTLTETRAKPNSTVFEFDQVRVWKGEGNAGQEAFDWYRRRMSEGVTMERAVEDANSKHPASLAMVNVETVHTRWVNNASAFLAAADGHVQDRFNVAIADWMLETEREKDEARNRWKPKAGDGGAWVVEVRGYTDHKGGRRFIEQSVLRNLQRIDAFAKDEKNAGRPGAETANPVKGRVGHPFVYAVWPDFTPQPGVFQHIGPGKSYLDGLVGDDRAGANGMGAPDAALAPAWKGLGGSGGATGPGIGARRPAESTKTRYEFVVMFVWREPTAAAPAAP